jgi:hypothetical protein
MDKLQWFKFTTMDWMMGKIQKCPEVTQARFLRLCCLYWNKDCNLSIEDAEIEIDKEHLDILLSKKIIKIVDDLIIIEFLNEQLNGICETSIKRRDAVNKRWEKKRSKEIQNNTSVLKNDTSVIQSDTDKSRVREEEIRVDNIKKNNIDERKLKFASTLKPFVETYGRNLIKEFYEYWTEPNKSNTKFKQELEKTWSLERRLETWAKNDKNFKKEKGSAQKEKSEIIAGRQTMETIQKNLDTTGLYVPGVGNQ